MEAFDQILEQYAPMMYRVLKRARVYKNHDYYKHCATIALWEAWKNYDPARGPFAPYAYRMMLTAVFREMSLENRYDELQTSCEKETLTFLAHQRQMKTGASACPELFMDLESLVTREEMELLLDIYYYRYKYKELEKKYGVTAEAIKKRKDRLLKRLRRKLR
ncbi:sigma-70 family RNA polymerase sigma factor [Ureibacillus sp. FSL K6-8385]|uniref:Sigma-70 family RNA polymerase sigma factor n=1 Tax=Ureibacillus terrenus TaxID=118246 RepID=A0A540UW35_9BACL|nr:sigma-70 family RNA polymerase sigma factor [Ureibacillus terrenus]MED3662079.1 sigma-70 family RNA polymerase sigma factor [Ureibacillus terrenus]MED3764659.1 sigma-70 family RNA polymerase sigma factor [Ureibacillus terrenus]TQE88681.1 sigma-70 family RNA polymerase sigma factor [Ureibacillus terrenus]